MNDTVDDSRRDILLAGQGDQRAYSRIVHEYRHMVRATCAAACADHRDVEELAQDVFVTAFGALESLRDPDRFAGWLKQIALNCCRGHARAGRNAPDSVALSAAAEAVGRPPDAASETDAIHRMVIATLAGLPSSERQVVEARIRGDDHDAIAASLGIAPQTSMNRLTRARKRLKGLRRRLLESAILATLLDRARAMPLGPQATPWLGSALMQAKSVMFGTAAVAAAIVTVGIYIGASPGRDEVRMEDAATAETRTPRPFARPPVENASTASPRAITKTASVPAQGRPQAELTFEAQLVQRWVDYRDTPAFQTLNDRQNVLTMQAYELQLPDDLRKQFHDYERDPFSILGLDKDTVHESTPAEDIQELRALADEKAQPLRDDMRAYSAARKVNQQERERLYAQVLQGLDMTEEEHRLAIRLTPAPTPERVVQDKRHWADVMRAAGMARVVAQVTIP